MGKSKQTPGSSAMCQGTKADGTPCTKFAVKDVAVLARYPATDQRLCMQHLAGKEAWSEVAKRGGRTRAQQLREQKHGKPRSGLEPSITLDEVYAIAAGGLEATFDEPGIRGEPDWPTRLLSCFVIMSTVQLQERRTIEQARQLLEQLLPSSVQDDPEVRRRLTVEASFAEARAAWDRLRLRVDPRSPLPRLYVEHYPPALYPPWTTPEERRAIQKAQKQPEGKVTRAGANYVLERDGELPLLVKA